MTNDKDKKQAKESKTDSDENENDEGSQQSVKSSEKKTGDKDPHRGITDTPSQEKEMLPGGEDPGDYFDDDGALDEELEDLDDVESDEKED